MAQNPNVESSRITASNLQNTPSNNSQCDSPASFYTASSTDPQFLTADDTIIAVMGPTGAGKSTFIKNATGTEDIQIGHDLGSCTVKVQAVRCPDPTGRRNVVFVDTPGFDDTNRKDTEILESIADWLEKTYRAGIKLSGVLYLHRITDNRVTNTVLRNLSMFTKLCGDKALSNVVLVTTHWERLETPEEGIRREQELESDFWKLFLDHGSQILRSEHNHTSAWNIVNSLPLIPQPLEVQKEIVDQGKPLEETAAGRTLFSWFEEKMKDLIHRIKDLWERVASSSEGDGSPNEELQEAVANYTQLKQQKKRLFRGRSGRKASIHIPASPRPARAPQAHPGRWANWRGQSSRTSSVGRAL